MAKPAEQQAPKTRKRRTGEYSFTAALETAEKLLQKKADERSAAIYEVTRLNIDIAGLEATIRALKSQLTPDAAPTLDHNLSIARPAPGEVPAGAGSILTGTQAPPQQQTAPDLDSLPGMEGEFA